MKQLLCPLLTLALLIISSASAQLSPDPPPSPPDKTMVLEKASHGSDPLTQLKASTNCQTLLTPIDSAFSSFKSGALNTLTDKQQVQLVQVTTSVSDSQSLGSEKFML